MHCGTVATPLTASCKPFHSTVLTVAMQTQIPGQDVRNVTQVWTKDRDTFEVCTRALSNRCQTPSLLLLHGFPDFLWRIYLLLSTSARWPGPGVNAASQNWIPMNETLSHMTSLRARRTSPPPSPRTHPPIRTTVFIAGVSTAQARGWNEEEALKQVWQPEVFFQWSQLGFNLSEGVKQCAWICSEGTESHRERTKILSRQAWNGCQNIVRNSLELFPSPLFGFIYFACKEPTMCFFIFSILYQFSLRILLSFAFFYWWFIFYFHTFLGW